MNRILPAGISAFSLCLISASASAEWRCDCTTIIDSCNASVAVRASAVEVTSDIEQCARVDYFIDGMPFVALVVGGSETQDWIARSEDPDVIVQSCQVCRDNSGEAPPTLRRTPAADSGVLTPLIEVQPDYPAQAAANGTEGHVELSFTVTPYGEVDDARVTASEPAGVFDQAAISALQRRRYPADENREPQTLNARFDFTIDDAVLSLRSPRPTGAARTAGDSGSRPSNQCLRESAAYNYGEMVEVSLMNACAEPLVVFACGLGTGRNSGLWVCQNSEASGSVLLPSGDSRIGSVTRVDLPEGSRTSEYAGEISLTRAPNSEYWSLACALGDSSCRELGRQWLRAIDRQPASVNPQDRTRIRLTRSY